jgi:hypothetical protein
LDVSIGGAVALATSYYLDKYYFIDKYYFTDT